MLTKRDIKNIENFESLTKNHQRVFKHRIIKKSLKFQKDLEFLLLNQERMGINIDKIIDINQILKLLKMYEEISALQNM